MARRGSTSPGTFRNVSGIQLGNLLRGYSADGKKQLVQNAGKPNRRSAFDLTWSVPKSVSALWSQAGFDDRLEIELACENAVRKAAQAFQELCGVTRRGHDGTEIQDAKLAMALFRHETARGLPGETPDPNLHWHLVVPNLAIRADGSTGAFDARALFGKSMKMALGALFRTELSKELLAIGFDSHRPQHPTRDEPVSWFELNAVPRELIDAMSKRRKEIESWLRKHGLAGAKNSEKAALATRHSKEPVKRNELLDGWRAIGEEFGFGSKQIANARLKELARVRDASLEVAAAMDRAITRLTDHQARFTKTELLRFVAEESQCCGVGLQVVIAEVDRTLQNSNQIVRLGHEGSQPVFTTREMLNTEKQLYNLARRLSLRNGHPIKSSQLESLIANFPTLRDEQAAAVRHLTGSADIALVNGIAGSGKTFMLKVAGQIWKEAGFKVMGTCLAANAAKTLEKETGIRSTHIHQLLHQLGSGNETLDEKSVLVIDEAGMVGTRMLRQLLQVTEKANAKIVLVGDHRQLQAIAAGAPFRAIGERVGCLEMNQITRQRESWARKAVYDFRDGKAADALGQYWRKGQLSLSEDRDEAIQTLVKDWSQNGVGEHSIKENQIFAGTNLEVALINEACQTKRLEHGELGDASTRIGGTAFYERDRIVITRNLHSLGLKNGSLGTITEIDEPTQTIQVDFDDGYQVWIDLTQFSELKLAYALSTHKGQGQTVENSFVLVGGMMTDRELTYVQASRARGKTRLYADRLTSGYELETLVAQMGQSRAKTMALELERVVA